MSSVARPRIALQEGRRPSPALGANDGLAGARNHRIESLCDLLHQRAGRRLVGDVLDGSGRALNGVIGLFNDVLDRSRGIGDDFVDDGLGVGRHCLGVGGSSDLVNGLCGVFDDCAELRLFRVGQCVLNCGDGVVRDVADTAGLSDLSSEEEKDRCGGGDARLQG